MKQREQELETVLAARMLDCLGVAIDEVQESRQRIRARDVSALPQPESYYVERLRVLDQEIEYLQALQEKLRNRIDGRRAPSR